MKQKNKVAVSPLSPVEWDFSDIPTHDEKPAFVYEYARELCRREATFQTLARERETQDEQAVQEWRLSINPAAQKWRLALSRAFGLGDDPAPCSGNLYSPALWTLAESFPATSWQGLSEAEKVRVRASVHPFQTTVAGIFGSQLGLLPLRECASESEGLGYGLFAIEWTTSMSQLRQAFDRWLRIEANSRKLAGLPHPPDVDEEKWRQSLTLLPGTRAPTSLEWGRDLRRLGALRVQEHYPRAELADYSEPKLKVPAPFKYLPDLDEAAKSARDKLKQLAGACIYTT